MSRAVPKKPPSPVPTGSDGRGKVGLTIADLPDEEKARIANLAERLMSLGREHEETMSHLSNERARHAAEIDLANRRTEEELQVADQKLVQQSDAIQTLQEQRSAALCLLRQYQARLDSYSEEVRLLQRAELEATNKQKAAAEHVGQLERIIESQRTSAEGMEAANETTKMAFKETIELAEGRYSRAQEEAALLREATKKAENRCRGLENAIAGFTKQVANSKAAAALKDERIAELQRAVESHAASSQALRERAGAAEETAAAATAAAAAAASTTVPSSSSAGGGSGGGKVRAGAGVMRGLGAGGGGKVRAGHSPSSPSRALRGARDEDRERDRDRDAHSSARRRFIDRFSDGARSSSELRRRSLRSSHSSSSSPLPSPARPGKGRQAMGVGKGIEYFAAAASAPRSLVVRHHKDASFERHHKDASFERRSDGAGDDDTGVGRRKEKALAKALAARESERGVVGHATAPRAERRATQSSSAAPEREAPLKGPTRATSAPSAPTGVRSSTAGGASKAAPAVSAARPSLAVELGQYRQYDAALLYVLESIHDA